MSGIKTTSRIAAISLAFVAGLLAMTPGLAVAQSGTWTSTGNGTWSTTSNWLNGTVASGADNTASFTGATLAATRTISLNGDKTIGYLRFDPNSAAYHTLRMGTSGSLTLDTTLSGSIPGIDVAATRTAVITAAVAGTKGFVKTGDGTLYLGGANTYSGTTTVSVGTLEAKTADALGAVGTGIGTVVADGGRLRIGANVTINESIEINGAGTAAAPNTGALNFGSSDTVTFPTLATMAGLVTLASDASIGVGSGAAGFMTRSGAADAIQTNGFKLTIAASGTLTVNSPIAGTGGALAHGGSGVVTLTAANTYTGTTAITGNGSLRLGAGGADGSLSTNSAISMAAAQSTFVVDQSDTVTQGVDFSGAAITASVGGPGIGKFIQAGSGTTILNAANSYRGATSVDLGTLLINGNQSAADGAVTVASGATLGGSGTTGGAVSILGGAIVAPGSGVGTLTVSNAFTLANSSILNFQLNPLDNTVGGGINDLITGVSNLTLDGVLNVSGAGDWTSVADFTTWRLFNYTPGTLTDNLLALGTMPTLGSGQSFQIDTSTSGQVNLIVVPEPSALVLLSGLGVIGFFARRQRGDRG
ncbi:MAG: autotransporter-associated beta strand repeat-containing protein [Planctomycetota bacterium]